MAQDTKFTDIDILGKKFDGVDKGYSMVQVDQFLDLLLNERKQKNAEISQLNETISALRVENKDFSDRFSNLSNEFLIYKSTFKNLKPSDLQNKISGVELLAKINVYEKKLNELGIDPKSLL
jgi:DivIVA domain-containing protein